jgi:1,4-alpha-glucan branching enzyme
MSITQGQYGAHNIRSHNFICFASQAKHVSVVGDFNGWNPAANPMERGADGNWTLRVELRHSHHRYVYIADGQMTLDPNAMGITRDDQGQRVSLIAIS